MRFKTTMTRGGSVVQSGLDIRNRDNPLGANTPRLGLYRGLVLATYVPDDSSGNATTEVRRGNQVECDVLLVRSHALVLRAPVRQVCFGVNEAHGPWIPKPATRTLDGTPLNFRVLSEQGSFEGSATAFDNTDGDMVIVEFVEGNVDYPMITGALTHENTNRRVRAGSGWSEGSNDRGSPYQDEYYLHHQGTELRINANGDLLIDTVGAYTDRSTEDSSAATGDVRVRIKDGQRLTIAMGNDDDVLEVFKDGVQVRIDLGENASERLVLGDTFLNLFNAHQHTGVTPGMGSSGTPVTPLTDAILSDLAKTKKT